MTEHDSHERFLRLLTACEGRIRVFVRRLVPARSDADDVMQEIAVVLWRKFAEFRQEGDFLAWARGVAKFEVLAWRRDKARDREWLRSDVIETLADEAVREDSRLAQEREFLATCLERLSATHRGLLLAAYAPGAVIHDVARRSGRTTGGFYQWLHRTKRKLLDCVRNALERSRAPAAPIMEVNPIRSDQERRP